MLRTLFVAAVVVAAALPAAAQPNMVAPPHYEPNTWFNAPSLCGMHEDLRERTQTAINFIRIQRTPLPPGSSTVTDLHETAVAHARGMAILLEWERLEYWMADARIQDPRFQCYGWGFDELEDDDEEVARLR